MIIKTMVNVVATNCYIVVDEFGDDPLLGHHHLLVDADMGDIFKSIIVSFHMVIDDVPLSSKMIVAVPDIDFNFKIIINHYG